MADTVGPQLNTVEGNMLSTSEIGPPATPVHDHRAAAGGDVDWHSRFRSASERGRGRMSLDDRKLDVLRPIVEDYVATQEPVGSKALVERHHLGVSPATVRNDMAALEEEGLITQPHTSAGRVPTDKGYRLFVDRLTSIKPMSTAEKRAIST